MKLVSCYLFIFGGVFLVKSYETTPKEFPFQVSVFTKRGCGGALFTDKFIITSAYCINGSPNVSVYLGFTRYPYYTSNHKEKNTQIINSTSIIVHEQFEKLYDNSYLNDVALIKLPVPVVRSERVRPGTFLSKWEPQVEQGLASVNVSGWNTANDLMKIEKLQILSQDTCEYFYGPAYFIHAATTRCAKRVSPEDHLDLIGDIVTLKGKIIGLLSLRQPCVDEFPTCSRTVFFLNLIPYLDWISQKVGVSVGRLTGTDQGISSIRTDNPYYTIMTETRNELKQDMKGLKENMSELKKIQERCPCARPRIGR